MTIDKRKENYEPRLETQFKLMREIESNPTANQRQLAEDLGVSLGSLNYCLQALISKGFVKVNNFRENENKRKYLYFLTPHGISEKSRLTIDFLSRKQAEYNRLQLEIKMLEKELRDER